MPKVRTLKLEPPEKRVPNTLYLDPDLDALWLEVATKHKMSKTEVANQVFRAGLIALGELPPAAE